MDCGKEGSQEGEEWTVVKSKRPQSKAISSKKPKSKKENQLIRNEIVHFDYQQTKKQGIQEKTAKDCIKDIDKCLLKFRSSAYFSLVRENLQKIDERLHNLHEIAILGIGSIGNSLNSQWQLVWILAVYEHIIEILSRDLQHESCKLTLFDPILQPIDTDICAHYDITISTDNNKGFSDHIFTTNTSIQILYYMPHCPYRLYCNILWSGWDNLVNIGILGNRYKNLIPLAFLMLINLTMSFWLNSFVSYEERRQLCDEEEIERRTDSVKFLTPHVTEVSLWSIADVKVANTWEYKHQWESAFCDLT